MDQSNYWQPPQLTIVGFVCFRTPKVGLYPLAMLPSGCSEQQPQLQGYLFWFKGMFLLTNFKIKRYKAPALIGSYLTIVPIYWVSLVCKRKMSTFFKKRCLPSCNCLTSSNNEFSLQMVQGHDPRHWKHANESWSFNFWKSDFGNISALWYYSGETF